MGVEEFYLISFPINPVEKKKYVLLKTLVDYSSIETGQQELFDKWFTNLMGEEKDFIDQQFTDKHKGCSAITRRHLTKTKRMIHKSLISTRRLCMQVKEDILNRHKQAGHLALSNAYQRMKSGEAHTIHGNIFSYPTD